MKIHFQVSNFSFFLDSNENYMTMKIFACRIVRPKIFVNSSPVTNINFTNCLTFMLSSIRFIEF